MRTEKKLTGTLSKLVLLGVFLVVASISARAQDAERGYVHVAFAEVSPSAQAEFEAVIKDIAEVQREAGHPFFHVYQRVRGDAGYTIFTLDADMNGLPQLDLETPLFSRVTNSLHSLRRLTLEMLPELSIDSGSMEPAGQHMRVVVRTLAPRNGAEYMEIVQNEFLPALVEGGITDRRSGRVYAGGNRNAYVTFTYSDEFDGGGVNLPEIMGQRAFDSAADRASALQVSVEDYRYIYRPDLGYTAD